MTLISSEELDDSRSCYSLDDNYDDKQYVVKQLKRLDTALKLKMFEQFGDSRDYDSPFYNTGVRFETDAFHAWAYKWADEPWEKEYTYQEYKELHPDYICDNEQNFLHFATGVRLSWYKHFERGLSSHGEQTYECIKNRTFGKVIDDCIASLELADPDEVDEVLARENDGSEYPF